MTKNTLKTAFIASVMLLVGCTSNDEPQTESAQSITIRTDINDMTRTAYDQIGNLIFAEGDEVSVYSWTGTKDVAPPPNMRAVDNAINKLTSGSWIATPQMLWKSPYEKHYFAGVYPAHSSSADDLAKVPFTYDPTDASKNDILVAVNNNGLTASRNPVNLTFKHAMGRIIINLFFRNQWGIDKNGYNIIPDVSKVVVSNVVKNGYVNCIEQNASPEGTREDFEVPCNTRNYQFESTIIPQDGIRTITITADGVDYVYTHPTDIQFESGKITEVRLEIGKDEIKLGGLNIRGWDQADVVYGNTSGYNTAKYITDKNKLTMLYSLVDKEVNMGRIYEMEYTEDYKLDDALQANITNITGLQAFVADKLYDRQPIYSPKMSFDAGCSAFAVTDDATGHYLMGRNYDFLHTDANGNDTEIAAIVVKTAPRGGKRSVSVVDGYWLGMNRRFYTDGKTDLSMLMAAPYAFMDGINEDGLAMGVLHLDGKPAIQNEQGKPNVFMNIAMRMLLDKAADIDEAVALLKQYNIHMTSPAGGSFHFFMADAKGKYAIVEYVSEKGDIDENPWKIDVLTGDDRYRYATNFYVSEYMKDTPYGNKSSHGKDRYEKMEHDLWTCGFLMNEDGVKNMLDKVSQALNPKDPTSYTQWSSIYDLTQKTLKLHLLREYYGKQAFEFGIQ